MQFHFAPMEGATDVVFRAVHRQLIGGADLYWMPFWAPTQDHVLTPRVRRELSPAGNEGIPVLPQLLTKSARDFLWAAGELKAMGYEEVNLNLGCPSGTVTAKGKGAGFLGDLPRLERFLDEVFDHTPLRVSIKTRMGVRDGGEFQALLALYGRYPLARLAVHARVLQDQYRAPVRPEGFTQALAAMTCPVVCNGDLKTVAQCRAAAAVYPAAGLMAGRGFLADPALGRKLRGGAPLTAEELRGFHRTLFEGYVRAFGSERNAMLRMKEHWRHLLCLLRGGESWAKPLRREAAPRRFAALAETALDACGLREDAEPDW
ncbi:MAG: tRNA-dihydrouridine synthase family protein [Oscillospiraceae bacterium]|nr:tRNA-dihydrouridine synthase family protein [Oscillospiraceae bacterium]